MRAKLSLFHALLWILLSTCLISGTATGVWMYHRHMRCMRAQNDRYLVRNIVQSGPEKNALPTLYLAELMGLSMDHPQNLYSLDKAHLESRLLESPVIRQACVSYEPPCTLYVDYTVRRPIALLFEYNNTAIDSEGRLFPLSPFFSPKRLAEVYLGMAFVAGAMPWELPISERAISHAVDLLRLLQTQPFRLALDVKRIDVSQVACASYGQRQIVLLVEDQILKKEVLHIYPRLLRLNPEEVNQALANYLTLREKLLALERQAPALSLERKVVRCPLTVIDLRLSHLAYITRGVEKVELQR